MILLWRFKKLQELVIIATAAIIGFDQQAEFLYVPATEVTKRAAEMGAIPYDIPGVDLSHEGEFCSFAFLKKYQLMDPALQQLAAIVRGADNSRLSLTPQSSGLYVISLGLSHNFPDDHGMLKQDWS